VENRNRGGDLLWWASRITNVAPDSCGLPSGSTLGMGSGHERVERLATAPGKHVRVRPEQRCVLRITRVLVAMALLRCAKRQMPTLCSADGLCPLYLLLGCRILVRSGRRIPTPAAISIDHLQSRTTQASKNKQLLWQQKYLRHDSGTALRYILFYITVRCSLAKRHMIT
jgi:hypothetical protein